MPLAMSRPWKHPKTGIYWLRKRVPDRLLTLVGKREELRTLGTRDPAEAKVRHAAALAEIEARWATLRAGPKQLSEREALDLAAPVGEWLISQYRNNPSEQKLWRTEYGAALFLHKRAVALGDYSDPKAAFAIRDGDIDIMQMEQWCRNAAAELSNARGLQLDETALQLVAQCVARIMQAAGLKLKRLAEGEREGPNNSILRKCFVSWAVRENHARSGLLHRKLDVSCLGALLLLITAVSPVLRMKTVSPLMAIFANWETAHLRQL